ncbi:MAG TPA: PKD domain-containing protein, partial [Methanolinea sp.]|nr:PKD domain-containing protein [Methanolinea sp.]
MRTERLRWLVILVPLFITVVSGTAGFPLVDLHIGDAGFGDSLLDNAPYGIGGGERGLEETVTAIPLHFIKNAGQSDDDVEFVVISDGGSIFFTREGMRIKLVTLVEGTPTAALIGYRFAGAEPSPRIVGIDPLEGKVHFLVGNEPAKWLTGVSTYRAIRYHELYDGIDLLYQGTPEGIKSTFIVAPGASPQDVTFDYSGIEGLTIGDDGSLYVHTAVGALVESAPVCYQEIDGTIIPVDSSYILKGSNGAGFAVGPYDAKHPLFIDPVMKYGLYLRGIGVAYGRSVALDDAGNAFLTGESFPAPYTMSPGSHDMSGEGIDVVVAKVNPQGTAPLFVTYIGGKGDDIGRGISVDAEGHACITGQTNSTDFPTASAIKDTLTGKNDAFVTKLSPDGSDLLFSTYLGGGENDTGNAIALDRWGDIYITGNTLSSDFPGIRVPHETTYRGSQDAYILKMKSDGSDIDFFEFIGGRGIDAGNGVAVDHQGNSYVTGDTYSLDFPVVNAMQGALGGSRLSDAFITKISPDGSEFVYSTYLGGGQVDSGRSIAVDAKGRAHVTGATILGVFPVKNPYQGAGGCADAFYSRLSPDGRTLEYSTYIGGVNNDEGMGVAVDDCGVAYVTGFTFSPDLPLINPYQRFFGGGAPYNVELSDAFVVKFVPWDTTPDYVTFLGGNGNDVGRGIAINRKDCTDCADNRTCVSITGFTDSTNFPSSSPYPIAFEPKGSGGFLFTLCDDSESPAMPVADFSAEPTSGCPAPLLVQFTDLSTGIPTSWNWSFGDGAFSSQQHPNHTYTAPGTYNVTLTVTNVCGSDSLTKYEYISICPIYPPVADFFAEPTSGCPAPLLVQFTDTSLNGPTSWNWSFGDGAFSSQQHPNHTYTAPGTYNVTLTVTNDAGSDSLTKSEYIYVCPFVPPIADFFAEPTSGCPAPLLVQFTDTSLNGPTSWNWSFGDGAFSSQQHP